MEPAPKILLERSSPAIWEPGGWVWLVGVARGCGGDSFGVKHGWMWTAAVVVLHPRCPQEPNFWWLGPVICKIQKLDFVPVEAPLLPQFEHLPGVTGWTGPSWAEDTTSEGHWPTNENSHCCLNQQNSQFLKILAVKFLNRSVLHVLSAKFGSSCSCLYVIYLKNYGIYHKAGGLVQHSWLFKFSWILLWHSLGKPGC